MNFRQLRQGRGWQRPFLLIVLPCIAVIGGLLIWLMGGRFISTENAYVKADIAQIAAEVAGRVGELHVKDHAVVKAGDVLVKIDPEPLRLALARAEAELDSARAALSTLVASWKEAKSELVESESKATYWDAQLERQKKLIQRGVVASSKYEEVESNAVSARDHVAVAREKVARMLAQLGNRPDRQIDEYAMVRQKIADRDRARLDLERTTIRAPISGTVVNFKMQPGDQVKLQTTLFAIVSEARPWVEANFKETELTHVRPGLNATIVLDIYPGVEWDAEVESISPATGAEFAILPPQNATGNWVKVVQRLPVRLRLKPRSGEPPLRAGMTATVKIDTERERRISHLLGGSASATASLPPARK